MLSVHCASVAERDVGAYPLEFSLSESSVEEYVRELARLLRTSLLRERALPEPLLVYPSAESPKYEAESERR